jgi:hypothetical protein
MSTQNVHPHRLIVLLGLVLALALGVAAVSAQEDPFPDKRLNQTVNFGGDTLYCVDDAFNNTNDSATFDHFQLLSVSGQPLWELPRSTVEEGLGQIKITPNVPQLLGSGQGTYGQINLYSNVAQDGSPYFIFTGFDQYRKPNYMIFYGCTPVGNALSAPATATPVP